MFSNLEILVGGCLFGFIAIAIIVSVIIDKAQNSKAKKQYKKALREQRRAKELQEYAEIVAYASRYDGVNNNKIEKYRKEEL